jgi:hypothetical protein
LSRRPFFLPPLTDRRQTLRDELAAQAKRRALASLQERISDAQRRLPRLAIRRAAVQARLAHAVDVGDATEHLDAEVAWINQRQAGFEAFLRTARNRFQ